MNRILTTLLIAMFALTTGSCSNKISLEGEWRIASVGEEVIQAAEASPSLTFNTETGRIHGYTGVNIINGEFERKGRRLSLKGIGVTMMAGPEEDMKLERMILDSFERVTRIKVNAEGELNFINSDGEVIMVLARR